MRAGYGSMRIPEFRIGWVMGLVAVFASWKY